MDKIKLKKDLGKVVGTLISSYGKRMSFEVYVSKRKGEGGQEYIFSIKRGKIYSKI